MEPLQEQIYAKALETTIESKPTAHSTTLIVTEEGRLPNKYDIKFRDTFYAAIIEYQGRPLSTIARKLGISQGIAEAYMREDERIAYRAVRKDYYIGVAENDNRHLSTPDVEAKVALFEPPKKRTVPKQMIQEHQEGPPQKKRSTIKTASTNAFSSPVEVEPVQATEGRLTTILNYLRQYKEMSLTQLERAVGRKINWGVLLQHAVLRGDEEKATIHKLTTGKDPLFYYDLLGEMREEPRLVFYPYAPQ